ncbi:MAG: hypothetical protein Q9209_002297 [Squamulea sp. 1 TL-2023]
MVEHHNAIGIENRVNAMSDRNDVGPFFYLDSLLFVRTEDAPQVGIVMDMPGIKIVSDSALKQRGILRNDCKTTSYIEQSDGRSVEIINRDLATDRLDDPEQSQSERGLACSCPSYNPNLE